MISLESGIFNRVLLKLVLVGWGEYNLKNGTAVIYKEAL